MLQYFSRHSYTLSIGLLIAVSIQLMSVSVRNPELPASGWGLLARILYPVQKLTHEVFETADFIWNRYIWLQHVALERDILLLQLGELQERNSTLSELAHENERLRSLLNYSDMTSHESIVASVIGRDPSNWLMTLTIDKGSDHGIRTGLPVVSGDGVVGQVASVGAQSATVLMINDTASGVGAMLQNSRAIGVIEGVFKSNEVSLGYIENIQEEVVGVGERVITSGMDGVFPKGLLIGEVKSISDNPGSLFRDILVQPAANLKKIELVTVLLPKGEE
jgi:rod shape-determining protein MreC